MYVWGDLCKLNCGRDAEAMSMRVWCAVPFGERPLNQPSSMLMWMYPSWANPDEMKYLRSTQVCMGAANKNMARSECAVHVGHTTPSLIPRKRENENIVEFDSHLVTFLM
jgi:hypothetical protein